MEDEKIVEMMMIKRSPLTTFDVSCSFYCNWEQSSKSCPNL